MSTSDLKQEWRPKHGSALSLTRDVNMQTNAVLWVSRPVRFYTCAHQELCYQPHPLCESIRAFFPMFSLGNNGKAYYNVFVQTKRRGEQASRFRTATRYLRLQ